MQPMFRCNVIALSPSPVATRDLLPKGEGEQRLCILPFSRWEKSWDEGETLNVMTLMFRRCVRHCVQRCAQSAVRLCGLLVASLLLTVLFLPVLRAQSAAGEQATIESRTIVDMPTAGVLPKGRYGLEVYAFGESGVMVDFSIAPLTNLNVGLSYSGAGLLGNSGVVFQGLPGFHVRWRPLDETRTIPAVLVGLNTQGRGFPNINGRFQTHSPGVFVAVSKNFALWGSLALHGGINYSFEPALADRRLNAYIGLEKTLGSIVSLTAEYNAAFDNPYTMRYTGFNGGFGGLLNFGVRVATGKGFTFELQARDVLQNLRGSATLYRTLRMEYTAAF